MINPALSAPSPNLIMKPGTAPADLHRIPDATVEADVAGMQRVLDRSLTSWLNHLKHAAEAAG
jgi:hypothetical protein